jgi:hypothetical protein
VILVWDGAPGFETLMLHRNSELAFGGMGVFPGGREHGRDRRIKKRDSQHAGPVVTSHRLASWLG